MNTYETMNETIMGSLSPRKKEPLLTLRDLDTKIQKRTVRCSSSHNVSVSSELHKIHDRMSRLQNYLDLSISGQNQSSFDISTKKQSVDENSLLQTSYFGTQNTTNESTKIKVPSGNINANKYARSESLQNSILTNQNKRKKKTINQSEKMQKSIVQVNNRQLLKKCLDSYQKQNMKLAYRFNDINTKIEQIQVIQNKKQKELNRLNNCQSEIKSLNYKQNILISYLKQIK